MKRAWQRAAALLACAAIASCGGGGGGTHPGSSGNNTAVGLSFLIPSATSVASTARKPAFISTLTTSITVLAYPANAAPPSSPSVVANVGPGVAGCTTVTAGTSCLVTVNAPVGNDTFVISAFSGQNGTGSMLSQATVTQSVSVGMGPIAVTLTATGASVTGDMLGYVANRTWTYVVNSGSVGSSYGIGYYNGYTGYGVGGGPFVVGIYADPTVTGGITTLVAFVAPIGTSNPFVTQDQLNNKPFLAGAMGVQAQANGYLVSSYGSVANSSFGTVPGTPMLVPSTLQLGQSWNPLTNAVTSTLLGVSAVATVTAVGAVPGIAFCPGSPAAGATVRYTLAPANGSATTNSSVSYVPGCGITDYVASTGTEFMLSAVGSMNLGNLDVARQTQSATFLGTLHTLWQHIFVKHGI